MSTTTIETPKIFISYSWTTPEHELWVLGLAERLVSDGVNVILDKWDLKEGQDKNVFMERMVTDKDVSKVLVVCDKTYAEKANSRQGGVGTESQIISKNVYDQVDQQKFIPLIVEYGEDGKPCLPTFFGARIYIDFSSEEKVSGNYEQLLRSIYNRPAYKKPSLGKPPLHIFDDRKGLTSTSSKLQMFKDAVLKDKSNLAQGILNDYFSSYTNALEQFKITDAANEPLDEKLIQSINQELPYRDEFIDLSLFMARYVSNPALYEEVAHFFESLLAFTGWPADTRQWDQNFADNYRFFIYELFLYLVSALVKQERFIETRLLVEYQYFQPANILNAGQLKSFAEFNHPIRSLDSVRKDRLRLNRLSVTSDLLKERAYQKELTFEAIMQTDVILFLNSILLSSTSPSDMWYPRTLVYAEYRGKFDIFARGASTKYFQKLKILLGVESKDDLIVKYQDAASRGCMRQSFGFLSISYDALINLEQLDTI